MIDRLELARHPEGGWYRETFRSAEATAILFLLDAGEESHWHRVQGDELWFWHAGAPLMLQIAEAGHHRDIALGGDVPSGQSPQVRIPSGAWQAARATRGWALVSCVVAPPFSFDLFELAAPGWSPEGLT